MCLKIQTRAKRLQRFNIVKFVLAMKLDDRKANNGREIIKNVSGVAEVGIGVVNKSWHLCRWDVRRRNAVFVSIVCASCVCVCVTHRGTK